MASEGIEQANLHLRQMPIGITAPGLDTRPLGKLLVPCVVSSGQNEGKKDDVQSYCFFVHHVVNCKLREEGS